MKTYCDFLQLWISPWQVAHALAVAALIEDTFPCPAPAAPSAPRTGTETRTDSDPTDSVLSEADAMRRRMQLTLSVEIPLLSIICFVRFFLMNPLDSTVIQ